MNVFSQKLALDGIKGVAANDSINKMEDIKKVYGVYLVRHGETSYNKNQQPDLERIRGWINVPLTEEGQKEAHAIAEKLKDKDIYKTYSSDLTRAIDTADIIIKDIHDGPVYPKKEFRPWNLGDLEGALVKNVKKDMQYYSEHPGERVPNGEAFNTFRLRFLTALKKVIEESKIAKINILIVTHYRNLKTYLAWKRVGMPDNFDIDVKDLEKHIESVPTGEVEFIQIN